MKKNDQFIADDIFTSKANVLKQLEKKVTKSKIEKLFSFTVNDWNKNKEEILRYISKNFSTKIVVRSSAIGEDSISSSQAGAYETILDINPKSKRSVKTAISHIIKSYYNNNNTNLSNQILIQNQTNNVKSSGVLFTMAPETGSPYFIINYEDGDSTTGVTHGKINNSIKIFRKTKNSLIPTKWKPLINAIKEIELILQINYLDFEFGINKKDEIIIFQARPITSIPNNVPKNIEFKIEKLIHKEKKKFQKLNLDNKSFRKKTIFSDMADWNPSEIIGNSPNLLDYSLYDFLIMKNAWHKGRTFLNYYDVKPSPLMIKFGNKPYVDVKGSFNSLIPKQLNPKIRNKLLNYYLAKLKQYPFLHDKVEFEILFTCYDVSINSRLKELVKFGFSQNEISLIKKSLLTFTNQIIENFPKTSTFCKNSIKNLETNRIQILDTSSNSKNYQEILDDAKNLLIDCRKFGTIPFSTMARIAFIGSILLKSLKNLKIIDSKNLDNFMKSISTPLSEIQHDIVEYNSGKISKQKILKKYGHLRPGTYDINAIRYDANNQFFNDINFSNKPKKQKFSKLPYDVNKILSKHGLIFENIDFISFVKKSLTQREELKFEFTKSLSDAIELIAKAGDELGFSRQEMSNLSINDIFKYNSFSKTKLIHFWKTKIQLQKMKKIENNYLSLPPLIFSEKDFDIINYYISKPNFITNKKITANLTTISTQKNNLSEKIILIENADPGYDWIFTKNPSALITKYGGVASHMAIRCAEIGLPAAIGCGELMYEQLKKSSKVLLDCKQQEILILEYSEKDDELEARKILKSLGYIK